MTSKGGIDISQNETPREDCETFLDSSDSKVGKIDIYDLSDL